MVAAAEADRGLGFGRVGRRETRGDLYGGGGGGSRVYIGGMVEGESGSVAPGKDWVGRAGGREAAHSRTRTRRPHPTRYEGRRVWGPHPQPSRVLRRRLA